MIGYLKGNVKYQARGWLIIDVQGVGYKIYSNITSCPGSNLEVFVYENVKEDIDDLYGFSEPSEMIFFELLLSVSGVGPKMGLAIMTIGSIDRIKQAIIKGDTTIFTTVPGIGKKVAAKIIVELKNKLTKADNYLPEENGKDEDLAAALEQLGYKQNEIMEILKNIPDDIVSEQQKLTWALKNLKK